MRQHQPLWGIAFFTGSAASFAAMNIGIRWMANADIDTLQIVFLRNLLALLILSAWIFPMHGLQHLKTKRIKGHFWRASVGIIGMQSWFYAISIMPLNPATALSFTSPIFGSIFAILFMGERAGYHRWSAIVIGFVGAMIIIRPGADTLDSAAFIVLGAASTWAIAGLLIKALTTTEPATRIVFYMSLFMTLLSLPPAIPVWQWLSQTEWLVISAAAFMSVFAQIFLARAYANADIVMLAPFDFSRLIFTALFAYIAFGEVSDRFVWLGGAIIVASAAYITYREARKKRLANGTQTAS